MLGPLEGTLGIASGLHREWPRGGGPAHPPVIYTGDDHFILKQLILKDTGGSIYTKELTPGIHLNIEVGFGHPQTTGKNSDSTTLLNLDDKDRDKGDITLLALGLFHKYSSLLQG